MTFSTRPGYIIAGFYCEYRILLLSLRSVDSVAKTYGLAKYGAPEYEAPNHGALKYIYKSTAILI